MIDQVHYEALIEPGKSFYITFAVRNTGSAPFYYDWPVEVSLLDTESRRAVWKATFEDADIRTWLPGDQWNRQAKRYDIEPVTYEVSGAFRLPDNLPKGQYTVALAILDPAGTAPSVRFAIKNYFAGGRHPIGYVGVGEPPSRNTLDPALFDDQADDRALGYQEGPDQKR